MCGGHAVQKGSVNRPTHKRPFETVATTPGMTAMLTAVLRTFHRSMPNIILPTTNLGTRGTF
jgi:hypothetical protein